MGLTTEVAIVRFEQNTEANSLRNALGLIGGIDDLNTPERTVAVKAGVLHACGHKIIN
jgi:uncharacterized protein (DUF362 family)